MSALSDVDNVVFRDVEADGDVREDPRWLALMGESAVKAFLADMARKHLPGRHNQDSHGDGNGVDVPNPLDKLKLARLAPAGFRVRSSKKLKTDYADVGIAEVDGPDGPQVRIGVIGNESGKWDAGFTGESRKAELREEIARKQALVDAAYEAEADAENETTVALEDEINELEGELEFLDSERTAVMVPGAMADLRRQLDEGLELAKANKAEQDARLKALEAIEGQRDDVIAEFSDAELEQNISRVSERMRRSQESVRRLMDAPPGYVGSPERTAELIESHGADVARHEAELVPLLARRAELMPPEARRRIEDLDRQYVAMNVDVDDMLTSTEVSAANGTRVVVEISGSDDVDEQWVRTRLYVLGPGETTDDADSGDDYGSFRGLKGLNKLIAGLAESSGDQPKSAAVRRIRRKHLPGQHPQESHGNDHGVDVIPGDKLGLAKRIDLNPGEKLLSSRRIHSGQWDVLAAEIDTPGGRQVRLGVIDPRDRRKWSAGPDPKRSARLAELDRQMAKMVDEGGDDATDTEAYERLSEERDELASDSDGFNRTTSLNSAQVAQLRSDIEAGIASARAMIARDERPDSGEFASGVVPGGLDGDVDWRLDDAGTGGDDDWVLWLAIRPHGESDDWLPEGDDTASFDPKDTKPLLSALAELSGDQPKSSLRRDTHLPEGSNRSETASKGAPMATKSFNPTIKAVGEGTATLKIASFGEVDKDGDVTEPGYFGVQHVQMVPTHDWNHVWIGKGRIYEKADGAYCDVKFNLKIQAAKDWYEAIKFDFENPPSLAEYSYGFEILPGGSKAGQHQGRQVRYLTPRDDGTPGAKVFEVSPVLQGAGTGTRTAGVKAADRRRPADASRSRAVKGAIPSHETKTVSRAWDRVRTEAALPEDARPSELRTVYAWVDPEGDPELKSSYGWPHHHGIGGPANLRACLMGIAALNGPAGADMGEPERKGIHEHLAAHLKDADREAPGLRDRDSGSAKNLTFNDELIDVLAGVSGAIESASRVVALRRVKGKGMSKVNAEVLGWIGDELVRLKHLLANPVEDETPQPDDEEIASLFAASMARISEI